LRWNAAAVIAVPACKQQVCELAPRSEAQRQSGRRPTINDGSNQTEQRRTLARWEGWMDGDDVASGNFCFDFRRGTCVAA